MPRKEKSAQEVIIKFCMTAKEEEIVALITTMHTIVGVRFTGDRVATAKVRKPRRIAPAASGPTGVVPRPAGVQDALAKTGETPAQQEQPALLGRAQQEAAAQSPMTRGPGRGRRARPPVADAVVATGLGVTPLVEPLADTLPPQDTPDE